MANRPGVASLWSIPKVIGMSFAVLAGLLLTPAQASDRGFITVQSENDLFANLTNTDRHYTNGIQLSWISGPDQTPDWLAPMSGLRIPGTDRQAQTVDRRWGVALGHSIFTPDDTGATMLVPDDRPYAAWAHLTFTVQTVWKTGEEAAFQDQWKVDLGVIGPAALGEEVQNNWHRLIGADHVNGWAHQLGNEPGLNVTFERAWRSPSLKFGKLMGLETDVIPYAVLALGNVQTYGALGGTVRIGDGLPDDFGPPRIYPGIGGSEWFHTSDGFDWYLFAGAETRAVARDIFLDGNTFRDSHSVDKRNFVTDLRLGAVTVIGRARLSFTHVFRTREFHGQPKPDQFGSLTLGWAL